MSDAEQLALIQRFLAAPRETAEPRAISAWMDFYLEYDVSIQAIIRCQHRSQEDIDDLHQDVWYTLVRRLPSLALDPARGTLRGWVTAIARNQSGWCACRQPRHQDLILTPEVTETLLDPNDGPDGVFDRRQRQDGLHAIVEAVTASLPPPSDRIVAMHWLCERPACEIAAELGLSGDQVRAMIRRGTVKIEQALRRHGFGR